MKRHSSALVIASCLWMIVFSGTVSAATFESTVSQAMKTLKVSKGDRALLVMTDAPYVKVDGACALPWLDQAQQITGCTTGKGNLLFFQRAQNHSFRLMLFKKDNGDSVIISRVNNKWATDILNIGPASISQKNFWKKAGDFHAGRDLFTLASIANVWAREAPFDFLKSAELHNHICPGLTSGYLMAHYILKHFPLKKEEKYTVVACPVWCKEDAFQVVMDCTPGKKGMIVKMLTDEQKKQISVTNPAGMVLVWDAKKKSGKGAALSFNFESLRALSPKDIPKAAMAMDAVEHLNQPDRFVTTAAEFDLDETLYEAIIRSGTNPWEVLELVRK